jgi:hypothetical protein
MEKKKNNLAILIVGVFALVAITSPRASAQTEIPSTTGGVPSMIVPTSSITATPLVVPSDTPTETAIPTPTPVKDVIHVVSTVGTQYPWSKEIPVKISLTPTQSGSKLEIRWQKKAGLVASPITSTITNPKAGTTYSFSFKLSPYAPGFQRGVADIILTTYTTNFVTSKDIPLQLDANKVVLPITMNYRLYQVGMYLAAFLLFFVIIPFLLYQLYLYIRKYVIPKWLESKIQVPL